MKHDKPLSDTFNDASKSNNHDLSTSPTEPATQQRIDDLYKQLSQPKLVHEFTPSGSVTREVRTENDLRVLQEIEAIRARLARRRNNASDDFNRAHDGPKGGW